MNAIPCYVFDLDGTLADCSHRLHYITKEPKDWAAFFAACDEDKPIRHMIDLATRLSDVDQAIVYLTGRSNECRSATERWLARQRLPVDFLYMRKAGDHRDDSIIKLELLDFLRADGFEPMMIFEDRSRVVKAFRAAGVPCAQVAEGEF